MKTKKCYNYYNQWFCVRTVVWLGKVVSKSHLNGNIIDGKQKQHVDHS